MVRLAGLVEDFPNFEERGRADPLDALEDPVDPVGNVAQHHDFQSHQGEHCGQEPMLSHLVPNSHTVRSTCQRPGSDTPWGWPHSGQAVKPTTNPVGRIVKYSVKLASVESGRTINPSPSRGWIC